MDKVKPALFLTLLVLAAVFLPQSFRYQAQAQGNGPIVRIDPEQTETLDVGNNFTIYVWVENLDANAHAVAVQLYLTFDPTVLNTTVADIIQGPFMPAGALVVGPSVAVDLQHSPPTGEVFWTATTIGAIISGSGVLLNITFTVISEGAAQIHLGAYKPGSSDQNGNVFLSSDMVSGQFVEIIPSALIDGYYGTPVSLSARPDLFNVGGTTTLSGRVTGSAAATVSSVELEYAQESGNWTVLTAVPTNASGFFSYQWTGNQAGFYQFRVSLTLTGSTVTSLVIQVTVVDISSHIYILYYLLAALIVAVGVVSASYYVRRRRKPEDIPS